MIKKHLWFITIFIFMISILGLSGCGVRLIQRIEVKDDIVYETEIGELDCSAISLIAYFSDGSYEEVPVTEDMIFSSEIIKLYKEGEQSITLVYHDLACKLKINVKRKDISSGISFEEDVKTVVYDGKSHTIPLVGDIPEQATVEYPNGNSFVNAGTHTIVAKISCDGYEDCTVSSTLIIEKADYDISGIIAEDAEFTYDGVYKSVVPQNVPSDIKTVITYYTKNGLTRVDTPIKSGEYLERIRFICTNANYNDIPYKDVNLTIYNATYDVSLVRFESTEVTYDATSHFLKVLNPTSIPKGVSVSYKYYYFPIDSEIDLENVELKNENLVESPTLAGNYVARAIFESENENYDKIDDMLALLTVKREEVNLGHMVLDSGYTSYDGTGKSLELYGELPSTIKTKTYYNGVETDSVVRAGIYDVKVEFIFEEEGKDSGSYLVKPSCLEAKFSVNKISETITVPENSLYYNDDALEGASKCEVSSLPEGVIATLSFYTLEGEEKVRKDIDSDKILRNVEYHYVMNFNFEDEDKDASVETNEIMGVIRFKPLAKLKKITMSNKTETYNGTPYSIYANVEGDLVPEDILVYEGNDKIDAGVYYVTATVDSVKYEIHWEDVENAITQIDGKLTIEKAIKEVEFSADNIEYYDDSDNEKYKLVNFDLLKYAVELTFYDIEDGTEVSIVDLRRNTTYKFDANISFKDEEIAKNYYAPSISKAEKKFKYLVTDKEINIENGRFFYDIEIVNEVATVKENTVKVNTTAPLDAYIFEYNDEQFVGEFKCSEIGLYVVKVIPNTEKYDFEHLHDFAEGKTVMFQIIKRTFVFDISKFTNRIIYFGSDYYEQLKEQEEISDIVNCLTSQEIPEDIDIYNIEYENATTKVVSGKMDDPGVYNVKFYVKSKYGIYDCTYSNASIEYEVKLANKDDVLKVPNPVAFYDDNLDFEVKDLHLNLCDGITGTKEVTLNGVKVDRFKEPGVYKIKVNLVYDANPSITETFEYEKQILNYTVPNLLDLNYQGDERYIIQYKEFDQTVDVSGCFAKDMNGVTHNDLVVKSNNKVRAIDVYIEEFTVSSKSHAFEDFTVQLRFYIILSDASTLGINEYNHTQPIPTDNFKCEIIDCKYTTQAFSRIITIKYKFSDGRTETFSSKIWKT